MDKNKEDYSREIYEKFFGSEKRILKVTLMDDSILEGIFVSFIHGDEEAHELFISKWHFVAEEEIEEYNKFGEGKGKIINQKDIKSIAFK